jgi:hypothetical protein
MAVFVAVFAMAFALSVQAGTNTDKVKAEVKTPQGKEVIKATDTNGNITVTDVTSFKHGNLWKDQVYFNEYKSGSDYVYVMREDKVYKVKLHNDAKQYVMELKKGDPITITSTYPLAGPEIAKFVTINKVEKLDDSKSKLANKKNKKSK